MRLSPKESAQSGSKNPSPHDRRRTSKTAQIVAMLKCAGGATLTEIMTTMQSQKHLRVASP
jgi:hypothetical protein